MHCHLVSPITSIETDTHWSRVTHIARLSMCSNLNLTDCQVKWNVTVRCITTLRLWYASPASSPTPTRRTYSVRTLQLPQTAWRPSPPTRRS